MRLPVTVHPVVRQGALRRVLVPAAALSRTWTHAPDDLGMVRFVSSRADLLRLGALVRLAATSPRSALFVPLRENRHDPDVWWWSDPPAQPDLLVVRHDVGLRPSRWPEVRGSPRRTSARPATVRTPAARLDEVWRPWEWRGSNRLRLTDHAATLVVAGTARSLLRMGDTFTEAGEALASEPDVHRLGFAHLTGLRTVFADPDHRLDVYGRDHIFHRNRWAERRNRRVRFPRSAE
ncbi:hypothetical protein [Saccharothrix sp. Mg75]|uniref:hypothetical protein n=1 Tax=Saccharothrix sp. Mg75 TaxID=3445357 RepID=UPI003EE91404